MVLYICVIIIIGKVKIMKNKALKILSICLALAVVFSCVLSVSAAKYVTNVISKSEDYVSFVQPGDMDANKKVDATDVQALKDLLLADSSDTYSDVNGDGLTNICDLVLQDVQPDTFLSGSKITLKGKSVYGADITKVMTPGAKYKLTYTKTGDVTVKITGIKDYNGNAISDKTGENYFKTPTNLSGAKLEIVGDGTIENLKIVRVQMDNEYAVN